MDPEQLLEALCRAALGLGIEVRQRVLRGSHPGSGGLCRIRGETLVLLSSKAPAFDRATIVARALFELGHGESPTLTPECRAFVARQAGGAKEPEPAEKPGLAALGAKGRRREP